MFAIMLNYSKFKDSLRSGLNKETGLSDKVKALHLCQLLGDSRKKAEFSMQSTKNRTHSPWWNTDCDRDYRRRKAAWKKLLYNQCPRNWKDYKYAAATFRHTVDKAKEEYNSKH